MEFYIIFFRIWGEVLTYDLDEVENMDEVCNAVFILLKLLILCFNNNQIPDQRFNCFNDYFYDEFPTFGSKSKEIVA